MSRGKVGMMASFTLLALSSILLLGAPSAADHHLGSGTISNSAGGEDNLAPAAPVMVGKPTVDGTNVTVTFARSTDDADGFQAASGDFTSGGTFVSSNNVAGYLVRRSPGGDFPVQDGGGDRLVFVDVTAKEGNTYVYQAVAFDDARLEGVSLGFSIDVGQAREPAPLVTNLQASVAYPDVILTWDLPVLPEGFTLDPTSVPFRVLRIDGNGDETTWDPAVPSPDGVYTFSVQTVGYYDGDTEPTLSDRVSIEVTVEAPAQLEAQIVFEIDVTLATCEENLGTYQVAGFNFVTNQFDPLSYRLTDVVVTCSSLAIDFTVELREDAPEGTSVQTAFEALEGDVASDPDGVTADLTAEIVAEDPTSTVSLSAPVVGQIVQVSVNLGTGFTNDVLTTTRTVTNNHDVEDTILISVSGDGHSTSTDAITLAAGASDTYDITFASDTLGDFAGTVDVTTNDAANPGEEISLTASVVARPPVISVDETPLAFGEVAVGLSESQTVSIGNDGEGDLNVTLLILGTGFTATTATITVEGGGSVDVDVSFTPEEGGEATAILVVSSNDPETASVLIDLSGTGDVPIPADIDLVGSEFNFGGVPVGSTGTFSMVVRNVGDTDLAGDISLAGDATFAIDNSGAFTLAGSEEITVAITFTPADESASTGTITITSDDADEPELTVSLSGAGIVGEEVCLDIIDDSIIRVGDFEGRDGDIDFFDFFAFADHFGSVSGDAEYHATFDIDPPEGNGTIDFFDFFRFADDFGAFCTYTTP